VVAEVLVIIIINLEWKVLLLKDDYDTNNNEINNNKLQQRWCVQRKKQ
jgi:hypothetical protein